MYCQNLLSFFLSLYASLKKKNVYSQWYVACVCVFVYVCIYVCKLVQGHGFDPYSECMKRSTEYLETEILYALHPYIALDKKLSRY